MITGRRSRVPSSWTTSLVPSSAHRRIARFKTFISSPLLSGAAWSTPGGAPRPPRGSRWWLESRGPVVILQNLHRGRQECLRAASGLLDNLAHRPLLALSAGCVPALGQL